MTYSDEFENESRRSEPLDSDYAETLYEEVTLNNPWIPQTPTVKQTEFLCCFEREALYGGAAGGGKSSALLMAALQFVAVPGYAAIIFRKTYSDLSLPGALMDRAQEWLGGTKAKWNDKTKTWVFPSGATLSFGYLDADKDRYRYQSSEFQFIGFDELTQFPAADFRYLFSRLRRLRHSEIPLRMRAASNPGGVGHDWVKDRYLVSGPAAGRVFVSAKLADNPHLDRAQYVASLSELDPITQAQLLGGDWSVRDGGSIFRREWFRLVEQPPSEPLSCVRFWDLAASEAKPGTDPDWTAGVLMGRIASGDFYVLDVRRVRTTPQQVEALVVSTAEQDGINVAIHMEREPGSAGKSLADHYYTRLAGFTFHAQRPTGDKVTRASPFSSQVEAGRVFVLRRSWTTDFIDELEGFPHASHDDCVDAAAGAFAALTRGQASEPIQIVPQGSIPPEKAAKVFGHVSADQMSRAIFGPMGRPDRNRRNDCLRRFPNGRPIGPR